MDASGNLGFVSHHHNFVVSKLRYQLLGRRALVFPSQILAIVNSSPKISAQAILFHQWILGSIQVEDTELNTTRRAKARRTARVVLELGRGRTSGGINIIH
jgi:hypothetical protein